MLFLPFDRRINDRIPWAIYVLVAINSAIMVHTYFGFDEDRIKLIFETHGAIATDLKPAAWVKHMFLHAGPGHLVGNMAFLILFGMNVERRLGPVATVALYFLSGFAALATFVAFNRDFDAPLVGASGAVSGVVGMYLVLFRKRTVEVVWFAFVVGGIVRLRAVIVATFWIALELVQAVLLNEKVMVAHWAHVGGFAGGFGLTPLLLQAYRGYPVLYAAETKLRTRDGFDEKAYIPEAIAPARPAGMMLVAREWKPVTSVIRRIVDGVSPGSGAFARPSQVAAHLAPPQAEDLRSRLDRAGFPGALVAQQDEIPEMPFIFVDRVESTPEGLVLIEPRGARHAIDPRLVAKIQSGSVREVRILDIVMREPWRRYRISGATASVPIEQATETLRGLAAVEESPAAFGSLTDLDEYFRWRLQLLAA
jgi:membrane associated rhomboid family serine protease